MSKAKRECKKCGEEKSIDDLVKNKTCKNGYEPRCKECRNIKERERFASDPQYYTAQQRPRGKRQYYKDIESSRKKSRRYQRKRMENPETRKKTNMLRRLSYSKTPTVKERNKISSKKQRGALSDYYVITLIRHRAGSDGKRADIDRAGVSQECIEVVREQIKAKRILRRLKKELLL